MLTRNSISVGMIFLFGCGGSSEDFQSGLEDVEQESSFEVRTTSISGKAELTLIRWTFRNSSQATYQLRKLSEQEDWWSDTDLHRIINRWLRRADKLPKYQPQHLSGCAQSLGKLSDRVKDISQLEEFEPFWSNWLTEATKTMGEFNWHDLADSIWAIAKLDAPIEYEFQTEWIKAVRDNSHLFSPQDFARTLWAIAVLGIPIDTKLQSEWVTTFGNRFRQLTADELADCIWALAAIDSPHRVKFTGESIKTLRDNLHRLSSQRLANSIWAIATADTPSDTEFQTRWMAATHGNVRDFTAHDLARSVWAIAELEWTVDSAVQADWTEEIRRKLEKLTIHDLVRSLGAIARMNWSTGWVLEINWAEAVRGKLEQLNAYELTSSVRALAKLNWSFDWWFKTEWFGAVKGHLHEFSPRDLANSARAIARLGWSVPTEFSSEWFEAARSKGLKKLNLAGGVWALAASGVPIPRQFQDDSINAARGRLSSVPPEDLANCVRGIAALDWMVDPEFQKELHQAAPSKSRAFSPRDSADSAQAIAALGWSLPGTLHAEWGDWIETPEQLQEMSPRELVSRLRELRVLGRPVPPEFQTAWINAADGKLTQFKPRDFADSVREFAHLGWSVDAESQAEWIQVAQDKLGQSNVPALVQSLWAVMVLHAGGLGWATEDCLAWMGGAFARINSTDPTVFGLAERHQIAMIYQYGKNVLELSTITRPQSPLAEWLNHAEERHTGENTGRESGLQKQVYKSIKAAIGKKARLEREAWNMETQSAIDIAWNDRRMLIQVDGPSHFVSQGDGTERLCPADELLNAIWEAHGWIVVRIDYKEWQRLKTEKERSAFIRQKLDL